MSYLIDFQRNPGRDPETIAAQRMTKALNAKSMFPTYMKKQNLFVIHNSANSTAETIKNICNRVLSINDFTLQALERTKDGNLQVQLIKSRMFDPIDLAPGPTHLEEQNRIFFERRKEEYQKKLEEEYSTPEMVEHLRQTKILEQQRIAFLESYRLKREQE